jgi:predicted Fe-Mo cluster-binding NifX family protein
MRGVFEADLQELAGDRFESGASRRSKKPRMNEYSPSQYPGWSRLGVAASHEEGIIMNLCIPVIEDQGIESRICDHFGSAPCFLIVETESELCRSIPNRNQHHDHGMCRPLASLGGEALDGIVVAGIGMGALGKLRLAGIQVFRAQHATVAEMLTAFKAGQLQPMTPKAACRNHGGIHNVARS